jgi:hypothetical protein
MHTAEWTFSRLLVGLRAAKIPRIHSRGRTRNGHAKSAFYRQLQLVFLNLTPCLNTINVKETTLEELFFRDLALGHVFGIKPAVAAATFFGAVSVCDGSAPCARMSVISMRRELISVVRGPCKRYANVMADKSTFEQRVTGLDPAAPSGVLRGKNFSAAHRVSCVQLRA